MIKVIVNGAKGRMGKLLCEAVLKDGELELLAGIDVVEKPVSISSILPYSTKANIFRSIEEIARFHDIKDAVVIDFTFPEVTMKLLDNELSKQLKFVIGTTGFSKEEEKKIEKFSSEIPIVFSYNMSVGVNLLAKVVEFIANKLPLNYDVEIVEAHHRYKKDSPSGTAIKFLRSVEKGRGEAQKVVHGREGKGLHREPGEIGVHAVRGGDVVGDHEIMFLGDGERIIVKHVANSRAAFVSGAIAAVKFLKDKDKGFFDMEDILGIK